MKKFKFDTNGELVIETLDDSGHIIARRSVVRDQLEAHARDPQFLEGAPPAIADQVTAAIEAVRLAALEASAPTIDLDKQAPA